MHYSFHPIIIKVLIAGVVVGGGVCYGGMRKLEI